MYMLNTWKNSVGIWKHSSKIYKELIKLNSGKILETLRSNFLNILGQLWKLSEIIRIILGTLKKNCQKIVIKFVTKWYLTQLNWVKNRREWRIWCRKFKKHKFEKNASKLFVKLYFKWPLSLSYLSHRCISTESRLFIRKLWNFRCFSSKIQRKLKINIFNPNLHSWGFLKILFLLTGNFVRERSHMLI